MKEYKAAVLNKSTGQALIIEREAQTKTQFIRGLRDSGYRVNGSQVKEKGLFDFIVQNPLTIDDETMKAQWKLRKVPETAQEYYDRILIILQKEFKKWGWDMELTEDLYGEELKEYTAWIDRKYEKAQ